jgi:hypothetical protein
MDNSHRFSVGEKVSFPGIGKGVIKHQVMDYNEPYYMVAFRLRQSEPHLCRERELEPEHKHEAEGLTDAEQTTANR